MKIINLIGSFRKNGNTARLVRLVEEEMLEIARREGQPLDIETVYLGHRDIKMCRGCRICFDRGEVHCPLKDDLLDIKAKMQAADGFILASPVYVGDVSGVMKNWIDRMAHVCHRPEFADKSVYLIATTGGSSTGHTIKTLQGALLSWGAHLVGQSGFKTGALMKKDEMSSLYQAECHKIASRFYKAIHHQSHTKPSFFNFMVFKIQQWFHIRETEPTLDNSYWRTHGWTDPKREYFIQHQSNPLTVTLARWVGEIMARVWA